MLIYALCFSPAFSAFLAFGQRYAIMLTIDLMQEVPMPIYEYRCRRCRGRFSVLTLHPNQETGAECPRCHSTDVQRLISGFATVRSEEEHIESLADPAMLADVDENDPKSIARWARRMQRTMGEELGEDLDQMIDEMEAGNWEDEAGEGAGNPGGDDLGWA